MLVLWFLLELYAVVEGRPKLQLEVTGTAPRSPPGLPPGGCFHTVDAYRVYHLQHLLNRVDLPVLKLCTIHNCFARDYLFLRSPSFQQTLK